MRILVLSFYYSPDLSAGSFRTTALVSALRERSPEGCGIDVVTTLPNRYHSYTQEAPEFEEHGQIAIHRIGLPPHRSDMRGQARAFLTFARKAASHVAGRKYDLVFATSSRLMTAALGAWVSRSQRAPLYLDIRDIFVDTINDLLPSRSAWAARKVFSFVESWTMQRASKINLVSQGFEGYFRERYPDKSLSWFTNGIDDEFLTLPLAPPEATRPVRRIQILYAGNMGEGQGLHDILPKLAGLLHDRADFKVIGDGGRRGALLGAIEAAGLANVQILSPVSRAALLGAYQNADVLFLHLGRHKAFEKVLPSKVFEYAATGKPILAGVGGYAANFIMQEVSNAAVFSPGDAAGAVHALESLRIADLPRQDFISKYARHSIMAAMADDVLGLVRREVAK